jgi:hypothetical protein
LGRHSVECGLVGCSCGLWNDCENGHLSKQCTAAQLVFQNGDYFGRTVNIGARITDYARSGEVLVSDAVAAATDGFHAARYHPRARLAQGANGARSPSTPLSAPTDAGLAPSPGQASGGAPRSAELIALGPILPGCLLGTVVRYSQLFN